MHWEKVYRKIIFRLFLFVGALYMLSSCDTSQKEVIAYNDSLVIYQGIAYQIDKKVEREFFNKYYFNQTEELDDDFEAFKNEYDKKYAELIDKINEVPNLDEHNEMKPILIDIVYFLKDGLEDFYTKLRKSGYENKSVTDKLFQDKSAIMTDLGEEFDNAQEKLAELYNFELVNSKDEE